MSELILENSVKPIFYKSLALAAFLLANMTANASMAQTPTPSNASPYTSPTAEYTPFVDEKVKPWKEANDAVGKIGGWREYAKEANAQTSAAESASAHSVKPIYNAEWAAKAPLPVRLAWLEAVSKQGQAEQAKQSQHTAQTSSELARRMRSVGNVTRLQQATQHLMYAEASALALKTAHEAADAREHFIRALGLNEESAKTLFKSNSLPIVLPELPVQAMPESVLVGVVRIPRYERYASSAPSELRNSYAAYRHAYDLAKHHRDAILPLHTIMAEEALLRYNGMFIGTQELLAQSREERKAVMESISALQQFWQAEAVFQDMLRTQQRANPFE